jgi:O-antigen/teichoic acid export membrane protein
MDRRKIVAFSIGPLLMAVAGFGTTIVTGWLFSPEDVGRNNVFQVFTSFSLLLCMLGLDQAYVREYHESPERQRLLKACFVPGLVLLLAAMLASAPFAESLSRVLYAQANATWYWLSALFVLLTFVSRCLLLVLRMEERGIAYSVGQALPKALLLAILALAFLSFGRLSYTHLLAANMIALALTIPVVAWNTRSEWRVAINIQVTFRDIARPLAFGAPLIGAGLAYWGLSATSTIALRAVGTLHALGIYSMAMNFAGVAILLQTIFTTIWMPTVYKVVAEKGDLKKIDDAAEAVGGVVCFLFAVTGACAGIIPLLLPPGYHEIQYIVVCCMAQPLLYTLSETTVVGIHIQRRTGYSFAIAIVALLVNAVLSFLLVPTMGASGAAIANAVAYFVFFVARTEASSRVWRKVRKPRLYFPVGLILAVAVSLTALGDDAPFNEAAIWVGILAMLLYYYLSRERLRTFLLRGAR